MHRYRIVAQISLILSVLNLVLAAPIAVQGTHEARGDEMVVAEDVAAMLNKWRKLEAVDLSPRVFPDAIASSEHGSPSEESIGSGYSTPSLMPSLSQLHPPLELPPIPLPFFALLPLPFHPPLLRFPPLPPSPFPPTHPSSSGTSGPSEIPQSPQHAESDLSSTETYSPPHGFMPSHHFSASDGSMPSLEPISGGPVPLRNPTPEGSAPSHHSISDPPSPSSPPETPPDNAGFFKKNVMKKVGIVAGAVIVGGTVAAGILGSHIKHHKHRDCQDS
jgi:hypothetical protein